MVVLETSNAGGEYNRRGREKGGERMVVLEEACQGRREEGVKVL